MDFSLTDSAVNRQDFSFPWKIRQKKTRKKEDGGIFDMK